MGTVLSKLPPVVHWVKYFLWGVFTAIFQGILSIKPYWSGSNPMVLIFCGTKEEPLFQSKISLDSNSGIKIHFCWFNLAIHTMKCLYVFTVKIFRDNTIIYIIQTLWIFHFTWFVFLYYFSIFILLSLLL